MRRIFPFLCAAFVIGWATMASGATIEDLYGDKDGFGLGVKEDSTFNWRDLPDKPQEGEGMTDFFTSIGDLPLTWTHTYSLSGIGMITSATLEIFSGGQGIYGDSKVFLDGQLLGTLTNGDSGNRYARKDVINLMPYVHLLGGNNAIKIETCTDLEGGVDNWVLDYSLLTITYESIHTPVPPSMVLFGSGLIGLITLSRKRSRSPIH